MSVDNSRNRKSEITKPLVPYFIGDDDPTLMDVQSAYQRFLGLDRAYKEDPTNWGHAYRWLNAHPAFWLRREDGSWEVDDGLHETQLSFSVGTEGRAYIVWDGGTAEEDKREMLTTEPRIYVEGDGISIEDIYVLLAQRFQFFYDETGRFRSGNNAEPNRFEKLLSKVIDRPNNPDREVQAE